METKQTVYAQVRRNQMISPLRTECVPVGHYVSLPLPTRRYGEPGFIAFAAPAQRVAEGPATVGPVDRWWVVAAAGCRPMAYALAGVQPDWTRDIESPSGEPATADAELTLEERRQALGVLQDVLMSDELLEAFFAGQSFAQDNRRAVLNTLSLLIPAELAPTYRAMASDFLTWLADEG